MENQINKIIEVIEKLSNNSKSEETKATLSKLNKAIKVKIMGPMGGINSDNIDNNVDVNDTNDTTKQADIERIINTIEQLRVGGFIHYRTLIDNLHIAFNVNKSTIDKVINKRLSENQNKVKIKLN